MPPSYEIGNKKNTIRNLEMELNDLRQGLTIVKDFYCDFKRLTKTQDAAKSIEQELVKPLVDNDREFEGIWGFHEDILVPDPSARIPRAEMFEAFRRYITKTSHRPVDQEAFEFVFAHMKHPQPVFTRGEWQGYRLKNR